MGDDNRTISEIIDDRICNGVESIETEIKMSRRDQFAMFALAGLLACPETEAPEHLDPYVYFAKEAYRYSDAMRKVRKRAKQK